MDADRAAYDKLVEDIQAHDHRYYVTANLKTLLSVYPKIEYFSR